MKESMADKKNQIKLNPCELENSDKVSLDEVIQGRDIPQLITVEGPIGVGKTSLTKKLAQSFNYDTLLEAAEENPFLRIFIKIVAKMLLQLNYFSYYKEHNKFRI